MGKPFTKSSKTGRTILQNNTQLIVTHLLQNEKWLNDRIGELQADAEELKNKPDKYLEYIMCVGKVQDLINTHRLFVSELLPYSLPKLSATMNTDSDEVAKLFSELRDAGTDSATEKGDDGPEDSSGT